MKKSVKISIGVLVALIITGALYLGYTSLYNTQDETVTETIVTTINENDATEEMKEFTFKVETGDKSTSTETVIFSSKENVGEALLDLELVEGELGEYGLYIKTVNGITADYDVDQTYWAFYIDGEYASTSVDSTPIEEGKTYELKIEK